MKLLLTAALAAAIATPAVAQDAHAGHAGHAAPATAAAPAAASSAKFTLDTPVGELMADPAARAVVEASMPGFDKHPSYDMAKGMSLRQIQPYANGAITDEMLTKIEAGLSAIK